jgi:hypothetical protein
MRVAVSILLLVFMPLLLQEFGEMAPWIAERLLKRGTRWLPPAYRSRYQQDWLGELDAIPGQITKLAFAFRVLVRVPATERALTGRDALWVLAAKRALALLVTGLLAATHYLLRLGERLPRRTSEGTLRRRLEAEVPAALAQESRVSEKVKSTLWKDLVSPEVPLNLTSLPPRTASTLRRVGIRTYGDLERRYARVGGSGMLRIRNFGRRDLVEVVRLLTQRDAPPGHGGW